MWNSLAPTQILSFAKVLSTEILTFQPTTNATVTVQHKTNTFYIYIYISVTKKLDQDPYFRLAFCDIDSVFSFKEDNTSNFTTGYKYEQPFAFSILKTGIVNCHLTIEATTEKPVSKYRSLMTVRLDEKFQRFYLVSLLLCTMGGVPIEQIKNAYMIYFVVMYSSRFINCLLVFPPFQEKDQLAATSQKVLLDYSLSTRNKNGNYGFCLAGNS